ncbi:MAG: type II toxin-antitoxin system RelE/ParE family toxin [Acidobacteria bacterium]|nr:type II toxin-antitoxin system RelE/ParE family toxin [Acidobacteriota bacterium]
MGPFKVVWTEEAVRDLEELGAFIADDSPAKAHRILRRLHRHASKLESFPERGRIVPELRDLGLSRWRELLSRPWRIIYRISGESVLVEVVLDSRRDAEALLFDRLLRSR